MTSIYVDMDRRDHDPCPEAGTATALWYAMVWFVLSDVNNNFAVWLRNKTRKNALSHE
jgi:hypothetical protein